MYSESARVVESGCLLRDVQAAGDGPGGRG